MKREKYVETSAVITDSLIKSLLVDIKMQAIAATNAQYEHLCSGNYPPTDKSLKWYDAFVKTLLTLGQLGIDAEWEFGITPGDVKIATSFTVAGYTPAGIMDVIAREYPDMTFIGHDEQDNACVSEPARAAQPAASEQTTQPETDEEHLLTVKFSPAQGVSLVNARRLTAAEKANCMDKSFNLVALGEAIPLPHLGWADLLPDYPTDGAFQGCANCAWIISVDDAAAYKQLEAKRAQAERDK